MMFKQGRAIARPCNASHRFIEIGRKCHIPPALPGAIDIERLTAFIVDG